MATAGSAERPARPATAAAGTSRSGSGSRSGPGAGCRPGSSTPEDEAKKCPACVDGQPGGHPACPLCLARRHSGTEERLRRRSDPERSSSGPGRGDCDSRKDFFVSPALVLKSPADVSSGPTGKHKVSCDSRDETRRRICRDESVSVRRPQEPGVLSDSENEEPISRRIRNISAFIRKTKNSSAFSSGCQRSRSCTDPVEERGGKLKLAAPPAAMLDGVGISHVFSAGILLSSENSRSLSAPVVTDRRPAWRAVLTPWSSSTPLVVPPPRAERSVSPESNDSISEELNHFKPIVCSPCTPPKRLPDGRLLEPAIVKSTPRNLTRGLQRATSYEASPAVLQKWRQIELDRQNLRVTSKATLTSPVSELGAKEGGWAAAKNRQTSDGVTSLNKRKLLFEAEQAVKIRVPAIRYSSEAAFRGRSDCEPAAVGESCSGAAPLSRRRSFSPYAKNSGFQSGHQVPKESPKKESDKQSTSRRGQKKNQKTKHLDVDLRRTRAAGHDQIQQERRDRALAMKLQRQFDLENQSAARQRSPDKYFLRSWRSNQNRRRRGLRRSRRINKKH
ncbi:E3 ubiquitin-protein ligase RNF169 [Mugil cephalus]|uniref:E3 ubiquitin-protein ligase RNF169 n=1 Tax=Mugil cephalus TaxID=48193 RepID=UPI001FB5D77C|nr:E3 ubiquitin-protein ligase RNF169 [Mugil cephalus]